jgi:anthranilate phosphoribosyltransferase
MLTKEMIFDLTSAKLPEHVAAEHLRALTVDHLTVDIVREFVNVVKESIHTPILEHSRPSIIMDCCGTGGSGVSPFNTSTAVAFVLAAQGINIAKFGNRAITSLSGSFDFLDALGIPIVNDTDALEEIFSKTHLVFLYAPNFYPSFSKLAPLRKALGTKTIFNFIGPLLNPANPNIRLLGTPHARMQRLLAEYLTHDDQISCVVRADSGLDEIDPNAFNLLLYGKYGKIEERSLNNADAGDSPSSALTASENANMFLTLCENFDNAPSYFQRLVVLNSAIGLELAGAAPSIETGKNMTCDLLRSGQVKEKLEQVRDAYAKHSR